MKNYITWLAIFALSIVDISCNDGQNILSKFYQNGFKLKDLRIDLMSYNNETVNFLELKTYKYNRTTPAINATFNLKTSVKDKVEVLVQVHKFLSNEYRHFPIRFQTNLQRAFKSNAIGMANIKSCGNVTSFIFEKDVTYHFCNFVIDETRFPPLIPNGRFRVDLQMLYLNKEIALLYLFGEVYTPIPYPKN